MTEFTWVVGEGLGPSYFRANYLGDSLGDTPSDLMVSDTSVPFFDNIPPDGDREGSLLWVFDSVDSLQCGPGLAARFQWGEQSFTETFSKWGGMGCCGDFGQRN
jgi:hypothetical protein